MAWNKLLPNDDSLLINTPGYLRANWDAIELGTDSALLITNAKVASDAAIADSKLAQIITADKVSGAALTLLANIPSGAGIIPAANLPVGVTANKIVQMDATAKLPAVDASQLINLNVGNAASGTLPTSRGGTGATADANTASGVVVLDALGRIPIMDGSLLTNLAGRRLFTSSELFTVPTGITKIWVSGCGAGGGGSSSQGTSGGGQGGGGGAFCYRIALTVVPGNSYAVNIGTHGIGGAANAHDGTNGGDTSIVHALGTLTLGGGKKGVWTPRANAAGGLGKTKDGTDAGPGGGIEIQSGGVGGRGSASSAGSSGGGGGGPYGKGGDGVAYDHDGLPGTGFGAGGSGSADYNGYATHIGGDGTDGVLLIEY